MLIKKIVYLILLSWERRQFCGNDNGVRTYKSKLFLLRTIREIVEQFNKDRALQVTYHAIQQIINNQGRRYPTDVYRCEHRENVALLPMGINRSLKENKYDIHWCMLFQGKCR